VSGLGGKNITVQGLKSRLKPVGPVNGYFLPFDFWHTAPHSTRRKALLGEKGVTRPPCGALSHVVEFPVESAPLQATCGVVQLPSERNGRNHSQQPRNVSHPAAHRSRVNMIKLPQEIHRSMQADGGPKIVFPPHKDPRKESTTHAGDDQCGHDLRHRCLAADRNQMADAERSCCDNYGWGKSQAGSAMKLPEQIAAKQHFFRQCT